MDLAGQSLAHYQVLQRLGQGGMGEVFLAEDLRLGRRVALKVLSPELAAEPRHLERFEREARSVAALNHPNIVTLHSVEQVEGLHFLVLELVEGETLADLLASRGPFPLEELLDIALALTRALEAAHALGIVHRDLKPRNVMVSREGRRTFLRFCRVTEPRPLRRYRPSPGKSQSRTGPRRKGASAQSARRLTSGGSELSLYSWRRRAHHLRA